MYRATVATDIADLGASLQLDVIAWAYAIIGIVIVGALIAWVKRVIYC